MEKDSIANSTEVKALKNGLLSFNFGSSLIEIAALTSLIGSTAAESLALGDKGPAGLAWAMMTVFGAIPVVRLFIATATPGWLRESMGVSNPKSDAVVGLFQDSDERFRFSGRGSPAIAVECEAKNTRRREEKDLPAELKRRFVYVFNQRTTNVLSCIPFSLPGEELKLYSFVEDPWRDKRYASWYSHLDWILLALSMVGKMGEIFFLWKYKAFMLVWVTLSTWSFFFCSALALHILHLRGNGRKSEVDIITGLLPTCSSAGGERKILFGLPKSPRAHILWRSIWGAGAVAGVGTVIATYFALSQSTSNDAFLIWIAFQALWLSVRSAMYYLLGNREGNYHVGLEGRPWEKANVQDRARVRRLAYTLSKHLTQQHPRSPLSYEDDILTPERLESIQFEYPLTSDEKKVTISIQGIIPDTVLSSVSWVFGCKEGGFDFYDTCIINLNTPNGAISIPAARALSTKPLYKVLEPDSEEGSDLIHLPRGGALPDGSPAFSNENIEVKWCYWIPCSGGRWLHFTTEQTKKKGSREVAVMNDFEVTTILNNGKILYISLKHVDEVKEIIQFSRMATGHLQSLLK